MLENVHEEFKEHKNESFQSKMLFLLTNHSMKYLFTNDTGKSTKYC